MSPDISQKIQEAQTTVNQMYRDGRIDAASYHKCLVSIAYEWMNQGELTEMKLLLQTVPLGYYQTTMSEHMRDDSQYKVLVTVMAQRLVDAGIVDLGPKLVYTQAPAQA